jgi:HEAT repeat protein
LALGLGLLEDARPAVRSGAAAYLGLQRSRLAVAPLLRALRDPEPDVRLSAAVALGLIGDRRALHFLRRTMAADRPAVADAARHAAQRILATSPGAR